MQGPHVLLSYYVAHVISCGPGALSSFVTLPGLSLVLQNLLGATWSSSGHTKCVFLLRDALFILASASDGCLGVFHAMFFPGSLSWSGGGVSFAFVTGFVAKTRPPPLLLGLRASLYRPNQSETIAMGDCYILCGQSGVTWSAWAAHCQRCERFPFAARCSMKELSKTTLLLAPDAVVTGVLALGHGPVCFVSLELGALVLSLRLLFVKNFTVILVEGRGCLGAVAPRFLAAFHQFCVVVAQALVCPGPARLDISLLTTWSLVLWPGFRVRSPTLRRLPMGCHGWGFVYVSMF